MVTAPKTEDNGYRRYPTQTRSAHGVRRILDACAEQLEVVGYQRLTTRKVSELAEVSVGTFYQFFSDKEALVTALARRLSEEYIAALQRYLRTGAKEWPAVAHAVQLFAERCQTAAGFQVFRFGFVPVDIAGEAAIALDHVCSYHWAHLDSVLRGAFAVAWSDPSRAEDLARVYLTSKN